MRFFAGFFDTLLSFTEQRKGGGTEVQKPEARKHGSWKSEAQKPEARKPEARKNGSTEARKNGSTEAYALGTGGRTDDLEGSAGAGEGESSL